MDFSEALTYIKDGELLQREGWRDESMFVFLVQGSQFEVNRLPLLGIFPEGTSIKYRPHIDMQMDDDTIGMWNPTQADILANDWIVKPK